MRARAFAIVRLAVLTLWPAIGLAEERILDFHSDVVVGTDAVLTVTETIRVQADGSSIKHGIYRDFPQLYRGPWGLRTRVGFQVIGVKRDGQSESHHTKPEANGQRVYIGSESVTVPPGEHTYELTYRTDRQIGFFADHDELYWNVTGNGWLFPIDLASARVTLPSGARTISIEGYTGPQGAKGHAYTSGPAGLAQAEFRTTAPLRESEGLTIVATWPKGFVAITPVAVARVQLLRDNFGLALALAGLVVVLIYYAAVWLAVGRDPQRGVIIPLYDAPKDFSPAAVRYLAKMGYDNRTFTAAVLGLAVKDALKIKEDEGTYTLIRRPGATRRPLMSDEAALLAKLFTVGDSLLLSQTNHVRVSNARKGLKISLRTAIERIYFVRNLWYWLPGLLISLIPMGVSLFDASDGPGVVFIVLWLGIWTIGITVLLSSVYSSWRGHKWGEAVFATIFATPFVAGEVFGLILLVKMASVPVAIVFAVGIAMNGVFYHLLKAPTFAGRRILDQIEGLRLYLTVAEQDRLQAMQSPELTPELFDRFLPYALALGVEQEWAEKFSDVLAVASSGGRRGYSPTWYSGAALSGAGLGGFVSTIGGSLGSAISSSSTAPGSSSGSGGGGSSGGGGGGGGGGGW
jgi:uncharacterized membrane protein YgcG